MGGHLSGSNTEHDSRLDGFDTGLPFPFSNSNELNHFLDGLDEDRRSAFVSFNGSEIEDMKRIEAEEFADWTVNNDVAEAVEKEERQHQRRS